MRARRNPLIHPVPDTDPPQLHPVPHATPPAVNRTLSIIPGSDSRRSVWPVGAVSNTVTAKSICCTCFISSANDISSSMPGMFVENSFMKPVIADMMFAPPAACVRRDGGDGVRGVRCATPHRRRA